MVLKYFTVQQMKEVSRHWTEPGEARELLASFPQTKGLLGDLERVSAGLLEYAPTPIAAKRVEELRDLEQLTDEEYDSLLRGNFYTFAAQINYAPNKDVATRLLNLRESLLPGGLAGTQRTLREESGAAFLLEEKFTQETKTVLTEIPVGGGLSLFDKFQQQVEAGKKLGLLEDQKEEAVKDASLEPKGPTDAEVRRSHMDWIAVVRVFESAVALANPDVASRNKLLGPLQQAAVIAKQRRDAALKAAEKSTPEKPVS